MHPTINTTYRRQAASSSLSTNLEIRTELANLAPNLYARGQVLVFKAATTRE